MSVSTIVLEIRGYATHSQVGLLRAADLNSEYIVAECLRALVDAHELASSSDHVRKVIKVVDGVFEFGKLGLFFLGALDVRYNADGDGLVRATTEDELGGEASAERVANRKLGAADGFQNRTLSRLWPVNTCLFIRKVLPTD
jgi:hypothetical protein